LPRFRNFTAEVYAILVGFLTILTTFMCAYLGSALIRPMLAKRFVYPLLGIVTVMLVLGTSYWIQLANRKQTSAFPYLVHIVKSVFLLVALVLLVKGAQNYRQFDENNRWEATLTQETIDLIQSATNQPVLVNKDVLFIDWTILQYYFPKGTVTKSEIDDVEANDFWYFANYEMTLDELESMTKRGYQIDDYGRMRISLYHFILYRFRR
jgi:hypothetical protein